MKKIKRMLLLLALVPLSLDAAGPWKGTWLCKNENIKLTIDLYEESVEVPGMELFGNMNGYMNGNIYGVWTVTSCEIKDDAHAILRLSNDLGSETQECLMTQENDSVCKLELKGTTVVKRVEKKKLVKISSTLSFEKCK